MPPPRNNKGTTSLQRWLMKQIRIRTAATDLIVRTIPALSLALIAACVDAPPPPATPAAPAQASEPVLDAAGKARVEARLHALEPEFWTRRSKDGEAAANEWLRQQAVRISREEARGGAS